MGGTHTFPKDLPDWNNLEVIHRNTLQPRASFFLYNNEKDALTRDVSKSKTLSLSGTWKFNIANSPYDAPEGFHEPKFDTREWGTVVVPGMWQLQGYGRGPHYTNVIYPFPVDPPHVPQDDNETGSYVRTFTVPTAFEDHQLRLRFEGVDSSFHVWVNGKEVGYSQGSRNPSEFDITSLDQWWLSGIFRDVNLLAFPKVHFQDFHVQTHFDSEYTVATLSVEVELNTLSEVEFKLLDSAGIVVGTAVRPATPSTTWTFIIKDPYKWTAETPYLYTLLLSTTDCTLSHRIGFRQSGLQNGVFTVNGKPVKLRGVNRHEHHPDHGRAVPYDFLLKDLLLMKAYNINAIRTCHQPNNIQLYDLADELGLWVMDECDLECHGFGEIGDPPVLPQHQHLLAIDEKPISARGPARWTSDNPAWEEAYLDRARQTVYRDKNHACVILWSLGNEAFYGRNHQKMYDWIKSYDPTRLVHYEQDYEAETVDIFSRMYASVDQMIEFGEDKDWTKPVVLCEFIHAMGNGPGNIKEYVDAFYKYPRLMGGFVWEWANHGLRSKTPEGEMYYAYGGDFGDEPNDGHFVMDGILFSDHTPGPGLLEWGKAIEPVQVLGGTKEKVEIINRYDHCTLNHLRCTWSLIGEDSRSAKHEVAIPNDIQPGEIAELEIESIPWRTSSETYLELLFTLRDKTTWGEAGHVVASGQIQVKPPPTFSMIKSLAASNSPKVTQISSHILSITSSTGVEWKFDIAHGTLSSWISSGVELLKSPPILDFYRARTDNDAPSEFGKSWRAAYLHQTKQHVRSVSWSQGPKELTIIVDARVAPPVLEWSVDTKFTYTFTDKHVSINVKGEPKGINVPKTFARIGLTLGVNNVVKAKWFGRGPGESYSDKKLSQLFGTWKRSIEDLYTDYEFPQESGNRTDTRWVEFRGEKDDIKLRARFADLDGVSFSALHYTTKDLDECKHPYELYKRKKRETIVRLDWAHHGLGTGSCGPATLPGYELRSTPFEYEVLLE